MRVKICVLSKANHSKLCGQVVPSKCQSKLSTTKQSLVNGDVRKLPMSLCVVLFQTQSQCPLSRIKLFHAVTFKVQYQNDLNYHPFLKEVSYGEN